MPNEGLQLLQQKKREDSIERVSWALQYLKDLEGPHCRITAVKLADVAGLSRAALYKPHLRILWDKNWSISEKERKAKKESEHYNQEKQQLEKEIIRLEKKLQKGDNQITRLTQLVEKEKARANVYRGDYEELKEKHQRLLLHNLRLLRKLHILGIATSDLTDQSLYGDEDID